MLFVKNPVPGRVKTRIAATTGPERAAEIYRELVARVCKALPVATPVIVLFDPPSERETVKDWLSPLLPRVAGWEPQINGDLGARLRQAFAGAFAAGWEQVAVIGSDCVDISPAIFEETWSGLEGADAVIGPSDDGGYYLLALRAEQPGLFENVRWSTEHTLEDTLSRGAKLRFHRLPVLRDVDTEADWVRVSA
jgi:rSAM/selenodomain-associated transferase 1